jgi:hypothetical protein
MTSSWSDAEMGMGGVACPKPEPRKRTKARKVRVSRAVVRDVRAYVFAREREICRCCRFRPAESMHELRPRSLRGKVSRTNSVAVCGSGTTGCHGYLQANEIRYHGDLRGAEGTLTFVPNTPRSCEWMRLKWFDSIESPPMVEMETAE